MAGICSQRLPAAAAAAKTTESNDCVHSVSRSAGKGLMELQAEFFKRAEHYSLPNPPHRVKVKVQIMQ